MERVRESIKLVITCMLSLFSLVLNPCKLETPKSCALANSEDPDEIQHSVAFH